MTVDETVSPAPQATDPALASYQSAMRRSRAIYIGVLGVIVLVLASIVMIAWSNGEAAHTTLHIAKHPAPPVGQQPISAQPTPRWRTSDHTSIGTPIWNGTVITYSAHRVAGRSVTTGNVSWSYTRSDREVCQVIQDVGVTIAVFRNGRDCDQVDAFDSETGQRKWTRTLFKDGAHTLGQPTYSVGTFAVMITTPQVIFAIEPTGGLDRWVFTQKGCTINGAVLGIKGALISQTCVNQDCTGTKFCGNGAQLLLRDPTAGREDDANKNKGNPDQILWNQIGNPSYPVSADDLISSVNVTARTLTVWSLQGKQTGSTPLLAGTIRPTLIQARPTSSAEVIWIGDHVYAVTTPESTVVWSASTTGPASVTSASGATDPTIDLAGSILLAATDGGVASIDPNTGTLLTTYPVSSPPDGASVFPLGSAFLVAGNDTIAYR